MILDSASNDSERLKSLTDLDLDFSELYPEFQTLMHLATKVTGTKVTQFNLLDSFTQWTVATNDPAPSTIAIEDCVCRHTIEAGRHLEIEDLSADSRFSSKFYVSGDPGWRYYYGIPIGIDGDPFVGTLCVLDKEVRKLEPSQIELLKLIADEIINKLAYLKKVHSLGNENTLLQTKQKSILSDIRNPLAGIVGITELVKEEPDAHDLNELQGINSLINQNSQYILAITDQILEIGDGEIKAELVYNLDKLSASLEKLFEPLARQKGISLEFQTNSQKSTIPISKSKTLQVISLLIANAVYFSKNNAVIKVDFDLRIEVDGNRLVTEIICDESFYEMPKVESSNLTLSRTYVKDLGGSFSLNHLSKVICYQISLPCFPDVS